MDVRRGAKDEVGVELPFARVGQFAVLMRFDVEMKRVELLIWRGRLLVGKIKGKRLGEAAVPRTYPRHVAIEARNAHAVPVRRLDETANVIMARPLQICAKVNLGDGVFPKELHPPRRLVGPRHIFAAPPPDALRCLRGHRSCGKDNRKKKHDGKNLRQNSPRITIYMVHDKMNYIIFKGSESIVTSRGGRRPSSCSPCCSRLVRPSRSQSGRRRTR